MTETDEKINELEQAAIDNGYLSKSAALFLVEVARERESLRMPIVDALEAAAWVSMLAFMGYLCFILTRGA